MTVDEPPAQGGTKPATSDRKRIVSWIMLGTGLAIVLAVAWVGWHTYQAYRSLQTAAVEVGALQRQFSDPGQLGTPGERKETIADLQANASAARSAVDDPVYRLAIGLPFVGPNLDAVRQVSMTVDALATDVIPSLDTIAQHLDPAALAPRDGAVNLAPIVAMAPQLQEADAAVQSARSELARVDRSAVVTPVGDAVGSLQAKLDSAADITEPAARTARLLPTALGADRPRTYLVVFQNLAEPRATGGIFGSYAVLTADQGRVSISDQGPARAMRYFDPPVAELPDERRRTFGPELATYPADVNLTPDFPTAAQLFAEMYRAQGGGSVDGVIAIDPVALSYLLRGSAALDVDGVSINADNVVSTLLAGAYQRFDDDDHDPRDQFLARATSAAFAEVTGGGVESKSLISGIRRGLAERRLLYFSFHSEEQSDLSATRLSGAIDGPAEMSTIGIFLNDSVASKLGFYLHPESTVNGGQCQADGSQLAAVTIGLDYQPPADGVPAYVAGRSSDGSYRVQVQIAAPVGGRIDGAELNGQPVGWRVGADLERPFGIVVVDLPPTEKATVTFYVRVPPGADAPALVHTPTVADWPVTVDGIGGCGR